jgi:hypothetical protein
MIISYMRGGQQTQVQETLTAIIREGALLLNGVSYVYMQRGASTAYRLDSFELRPAEDGEKLIGEVRLRHGNRDVVFVKQETTRATNP